jgi:hypothetical protein
MYEEHRWGYDQPMPMYYPPMPYYKPPRKPYTFWSFLFDLFMISWLGPLWVIWIFCREMRKR